MIYYHIFPTAFGCAAILFKRQPSPIKRIFLPHTSKRVLEGRMQDTGPAAAAVTGEVLNLCREIQVYFEGGSIASPWRLLDLGGLTPLQRLVMEAVATVPCGATRTYAQISAQIGRPRACRFVGTTLRRNPFPVVIPCHRVVRADGSPGGFSGGTELKQRMLALENASVIH
jgi:methylated-DNA-[protein]-cysteine S-methyltransferase